MPDTFKKFVRLTKMDEKTHTIMGIVTSEVPDGDGEIADYAACKKAFQTWTDDFIAKTSASGQDISLGNIRLMHGLSIAGKATRIDYHDDTKQIYLETTPVDDEVWKMIKGGFITGYSMGGSYAWRKPDGDNVRFAPVVAEVSYVDNPCNPEANFAYVKADGSVEMRKFANPKNLSVESTELLGKGAVDELGSKLAEKFDSLKAELFEEIKKALPKVPVDAVYHTCDSCEEELDKDAKTKKKGGKELHASDFAYVGNPDDTSTWKLPIHDAAHARNALARFDQTEGIPESEKGKVKARIVAAAKKFGIEVGGDSKKALKQISETLEKIIGNEQSEKAMIAKAQAKFSGSLFKGLYDVSRLSMLLEELTWLCLNAAYERDVEGDGSNVPDELRSHIEGLAEVLVSWVQEETNELLTNKEGLGGKLMEAMSAEELVKAAKTIHDHLDNMHKMTEDHCAKMCKAMDDHKASMQECMDKMKKVFGEQSAAIGAPSEAEKAKAAELKKAADDKAAAEAKAADEVKAEAERLAKAAAGDDKVVSLQNTVTEMLKANAELNTKLDAFIKTQAETLEKTEAKGTLIGRDGKEFSKARVGSGIMEDTGI